MAKPELGGKRQCQNCGAKFFDLNRSPIVCPKCGATFQAAPGRAAARAAAPAQEEEDDDAAASAGAELVALEEADVTEKVVEGVEDIDIDDDDSEDDASFLEEEEDENDDVADLIDGDIETDEEA